MLDRRLLTLVVLAALACNKAGSGDGNEPPPPPVTCPEPLALADVSSPTTVVGSGTAASCTEAQLATALAAGGVITFSCGTAPVVIHLTSEKAVRTDVNTVLDGGGLVTLDGGGTTRLLAMRGNDFNVATPTLRLQRITLRNGKVSGTLQEEGGGAAVYHFGGTVEAVQVTFQNNVGAASGPDVAGGAIFGVGRGDTVAVNSVFSGNRCSSGGAVAALYNGITLVNVTLDSNQATGSSGSNGGNGGAVSMDGENKTLLICGSVLTNNRAGYLGSAIFRTGYHSEPTTIDRTRIQANITTDRAAIYLQGTALTMTASTVAGNTAANGWGGFFFAKHSFNGADVPAPGTMVNSTIADNDAGSSLGGAIWVDSDQAPLTLTHVTIAGNHALFQGGIGGSGASTITYRDTIIADNTATSLYNEISCKATGSGSGVMQWPATYGDGTSPDIPCIPGVIWADPQLQPLADNGGPTPTVAIPAASPAVGKGTYCTGAFATDQRGNARPATGCALGAYQP